MISSDSNLNFCEEPRIINNAKSCIRNQTQTQTKNFYPYKNLDIKLN